MGLTAYSPTSTAQPAGPNELLRLFGTRLRSHEKPAMLWPVTDIGLDLGVENMGQLAL
jgi:hypothetical protein